MAKKSTKSVNKTKNPKPAQGMLFEENYLKRMHQQLTSTPDMALAELVANAWDAGAFKVEISIGKQDDGSKWIIIEDDGVGMTMQEFQKRWKTLAYDRVRHQGAKVVFPSNAKKVPPRLAFGRNGIGRHGLLCFGDSYTVVTKSSTNSEEIGFKVSLGTEGNPLVFEEMTVTEPLVGKHGTRLTVQVEQRLPQKASILRLLSTRFLYDPQFSISVNGEFASLEDLKRQLDTQNFQVDGMSFEMIILHASSIESGIAFWQGGRLVGKPSWILGNESIADKRTRAGRDYSVIVKTNDLAEFVQEDWSGFRRERIDELQQVFDEVGNRYVEYCRRINRENFDSARAELSEEFSEELKSSTASVKHEFEEAIAAIYEALPNASKATIRAALTMVLQLGRKRGGVELLQKLTSMDGESVESLNAILEEWTVRDICIVLDEIDRRIKTIEAIAILSQDENTPELSVLHPLMTEARWLFGAEFDSPEYISNQWLATTAKEVFKMKDTSRLTIPRHRADIVVLGDSTVSLTGTLRVATDDDLHYTDRVLLIELKKGRSTLSDDDESQTLRYAREILGMKEKSDIRIEAFLVGHQIGKNISGGVYNDGAIRLTVRTFSSIVDSARVRLFGLRDRLRERYDNLPEEQLRQELLPGIGR